ncbi:MAG: hypothetical protein IPL92_18045 [Saprospiraceae bacterium]|nr:hypothetical protein [Candidatus Opimibacter iunctus]
MKGHHAYPYGQHPFCVGISFFLKTSYDKEESGEDDADEEEHESKMTGAGGKARRLSGDERPNSSSNKE